MIEANVDVRRSIMQVAYANTIGPWPIRDIDRGIDDIAIIAAPRDPTISYNCRVHCSPGTNPVHINIYTIAHNRPTRSLDKQHRTAIIIWCNNADPKTGGYRFAKYELKNWFKM